MFRTKPGELNTSAWFSYRSMLFVPDENRMSNDLLYKSPNYPVLNITNDDTCLNLGKNSVVIRDICNLEKLLEYFGFNQELTFEDIIKIKQTFFTRSFVENNCYLFGLKEVMAENITFYNNNRIITDPLEIEKRKRDFRYRQLSGHRLFTSIPEKILPEDYWDVLIGRGEDIEIYTNYLFLKMKNMKNAFTPHPDEGRIRKL